MIVERARGNMNQTKLKKQIEEIEKLAANGKTVHVVLTKDNKQAHLKVNKNGASRSSQKVLLNRAALTVGTAAGTESFDLDLGGGDITDAEIVTKIKAASDAQNMPLATDAGAIPVVTLRHD